MTGRDPVRVEGAHLARDLVQAVAAEQVARARVEVAVQALRARGASWAYIGTLLGTSRQAARQKYGAAELIR